MRILIMVLVLGLVGCDKSNYNELPHCSVFTEITSEHVEYAIIHTVENNGCNSISRFVVLNRGSSIDDPEKPFLLGATKAIETDEGLIYDRVITYDGYVTNFIDSNNSNYNYNYVLGDNFITKMNWTTLDQEYIFEGDTLFTELLNSVSYDIVHLEVMEIITGQ